jgi:AcrR family transcriptional regulator
MTAPGHVESVVTDPKLIQERRGQIIRAAVKLFSEDGFHTTTIQSIAREARVSTGLIYQYFHDKDDVLFLTLRLVLQTYEDEIPRRLEGVEHPIERLCMAVWAYCAIVDALRDATLLAYRSTHSLRQDRRSLIMEDETRTNRVIEGCLRACVAGGYMNKVNVHLLAYQCVMYCHSWALKNWAYRGRYSLGKYVAEGVKLLVEPFVTTKGRAPLVAMRRKTVDFTREIRQVYGEGRVAPRGRRKGVQS